MHSLAARWQTRSAIYGELEQATQQLLARFAATLEATVPAGACRPTASSAKSAASAPSLLASACLEFVDWALFGAGDREAGEAALLPLLRLLGGGGGDGALPASV